MPDPLASVSRGDLLRITAETWNAVVAGTRRAFGRPDQKAAGGTWGTVEALAINSTGADLREYKPCTVTAAGGYGLDDDFAAQDWNRRPLLTLGVPAAATDWVVVTLEAIPSGGVGRVAVSGVCLVDIASASSGSTRWAKATAGSTASLTASATDGTVRVLHVPSTGTPKRCAVYLHERPGPGEVCEITPEVRRHLIGVYTVKSGSNVTDVYQRFEDVTTDANGCETRGDPYCVVAPSSCDTDRDPDYYCIDGVCWAYYDGLVPGAGSGPYDTPEECTTGCVDGWWCDDGTCVFVAAGDTPPVGATGPYTTEDGCEAACEGGVPDCCPETIITLTATLSGGYGTMALNWDGATYWIGSKALSCGETLHLRYAKACGALAYCCDGVNWLPCPASLGSVLCSPLTDSRVYICNMDDTLGGCVAGSCGSINVTVAV